MKKRVLLAVALCLMAIALTFGQTPKRGGVLRMTPAKQGVLVQNFNPFSPAALESTIGCFYETLIYFNMVDGSANPWLAENWAWSKDLKTIAFTIRSDLKYNDGSAMTVDDVLYSALLGKENKALDLSGLWSEGLQTVTASGKTVSFTFAEVNVTTLEKFGSLVVVPKSVWSKVDPLTWTGNLSPVSTGPFMLEAGSFNEQSYKLVKNPYYWQKGKDGKALPYIDGIQYVTTTNEQVGFKLMAGEYDWAGYALPNIEDYVKADPENNKYWFPEGNLVFLYMNNLKAPFDNVNVRKAIAAAISQRDITRKMSPSPAPATMSAVKSTFGEIAKDAMTKYDIKRDVAKAKKTLEAEGYKLNSKGIYEKAGAELSFKLYVPTGWTDWVGAAETVAGQLKEIGVEAIITQAAWPDPYQFALEKGDWDFAINFISVGSTPHTQFTRWVHSSRYAPLGEKALTFSNMRYKNESIDKALDAYRSEPSPVVQKQFMATVVEQFMKDTPCVPLFFNPTWFIYTTRNFTGFPSPADPYAWPIVNGMQKTPILLRLQKR
ncbi:MAG: ABC transporter substrate-binding protein [Spirochaetes bacterium GWB1_59_5]|nr:MAG: ABC transporter substrate-binding protein [Spirochaetes bacterium GWB1_59_5]